MPRFLSTVAVALLLAAFILISAFRAGADPGSFARFRGGGPARTDCMVVTDVAGVPSRPRAGQATCLDGDAACDADATVNGTCLFTVRLCLDDASQPTCRPETITHAEVITLAPSFTALADALGRTSMPITAPETCTESATVPIAARIDGPGRVMLRVTASMDSGGADRDHLRLVCRPPDPHRPATFATIQRTILATTCTSVSCHGPVAAGGLTLAGDAAYGSLVGIPATNAAALEAGLLRVAPSDPAGSFLLRKLTGALGDGEGEPMPRVGATLAAARIELVRRWIAAGAPATAPF